MQLGLSGQGTLADQVYRALRARIESGVLEGGARLPGSRSLARDLGVSRGTVGAAYERLEAEGLCRAEARSGVRVVDIFPAAAAPGGNAGPDRADPAPAAGGVAPGVRHRPRWRDEPGGLTLDLRFGLPNPADFPDALWMRLLRREVRNSSAQRFSYPHPEGLPRLRRAVAAHLRQWRGLPCTPDQVLITHGAQQVFALIARALLPGGATVAVEDPGYRGFAEAARISGHRLLPVPVDGEGLIVDALTGNPLEAVYLTPAHQFPTGVVMSVRRRRELLGWAAQAGALIVEDDYDSAYRFGGPPLAPLKLLDDAGRVILVGSFSKTLFPDLRLGYAVASPECIELLAHAKNVEDAGSPALYQSVVAGFIEAGHYHRHLRRGLRRQAARRRALVEALDHCFGARARIRGSHGGLHLVVDLGLGPALERRLVRAAAAVGLGFHALDSFRHGDRSHAGLLLGYGRQEPDALRRAVALLRQLVTDLEASTSGGARRAESRD